MKKDRRIDDPAGCTLKIPMQQKDFLFKSNRWFRESLTSQSKREENVHYTTVQLQRTILKSHCSVSASGCQREVIAFLCEIGLKIMPFNIHICSYGYIYICTCVFLVLSATLKTRSLHLQKWNLLLSCKSLSPVAGDLRNTWSITQCTVVTPPFPG